MKGIIGKKLGMTQVFDQETGRLVPVTVIQAGPCPVVSVRTTDADGYDAVQLAWDEVPGAQAHEAGARPPEEERRRPAPQARRDPRRARAHPGRDRDRRGLRARREGEGHRDLDRQGLPGDDQAAQLQPRPGLARLAQRARARLDRRVGDALARVQGHEDGRPDGRQADDAGRAHGRRAGSRRRTSSSSAAPCRATRTRPSSCERTIR